jgi:hypothetical protein
LAGIQSLLRVIFRFAMSFMVSCWVANSLFGALTTDTLTSGRTVAFIAGLGSRSVSTMAGS